MGGGVCPIHGQLEGLGTFCHRCGEYVDRIGVAASPSCSAPADTRTESERKQDARPSVEALGWMVLDLEQGWRRDNCPSCGARIPGGHSTRVPKGLPDWCVMGHGLVAWIEWKSHTGRRRADQKAFGDACDVAGVPYAVCRTTEEAVTFLTNLVRERTGS